MNRSLTSNKKFVDFHGPLRDAYYAILQNELTERALSKDKYSILKPSCCTPNQELECRKAEWVKFYLTCLALGIALTTVPDVQSCNDLKKVIVA